tara:strand:+ start:3084 stop:3374 length:291 start_codon:yes stop_codon:yes gene_type:complete
MSLLDPKCLWKTNDSMPTAYTSDGYLLPCCWVDTPRSHITLKHLGMKNKELLVSNNNEITDIFQSDQWIDFFTMIKTSDDKSEIPVDCLRHCPKKK